MTSLALKSHGPRAGIEDLLLTVFSVAFFLASWLVANVDIGGAVNWVSSLFVVLLALPSYYYLLRWAGTKRTALILAIFGVFPLVVEAIGISTGVPYGGFYYTELMGFRVFGLVPWSVAFAFSPLILGSMALASQLTRRALVAIPFSALLLVAADLILDPAAVVLQIWVWLEPGPYYGIPLTNYTGWFMTATLGSALLHMTLAESWQEAPMIDPRVASSLMLSLAFWTGFSLWTSPPLVIPAAVGLLMMTFTAHFILRRPAPHRLQMAADGRTVSD
ncbi:MAG: carotenoid biosynthesis protein [Candidatus Thorarchaeota archaeon]|nr:carotenoid biosynthesis protein [Candidatus Thorarchaeota archaeon]